MKTLVIDIETDKLPPKNGVYGQQFLQYPNIVSIAWKVNDAPVLEYIINQEGRKLSAENIAIHGITNEMTAASPHYIVPILTELIACEVPDKVIGHNIYFDSSTIKAQMLRLCHFKKMERPSFTKLEALLNKDLRVDTMKLTTKWCDLPGKYGPKWPKLEELHFKLFGTLPEKTHSSGSDVETTHKCYVELVKRGIIK